MAVATTGSPNTVPQSPTLRLLVIIRLPRTLAQVTLHRGAAAAEFDGDPLRSPAQLGQPQHHRHILRRLHPLFPRRRRRGKRVSGPKHLPSFVEGGSVFMSPGGQFVVSPDTSVSQM